MKTIKLFYYPVDNEIKDHEGNLVSLEAAKQYESHEETKVIPGNVAYNNLKLFGFEPCYVREAYNTQWEI